MADTNLTEKERSMLLCVRESEFHNGGNPVDDAVWMDCVADSFGGSSRTVSGVVSSLVKKGLVKTQDEGKEAVIWITQAGFDAIKESK